MLTIPDSVAASDAKKHMTWVLLRQSVDLDEADNMLCGGAQ